MNNRVEELGINRTASLPVDLFISGYVNSGCLKADVKMGIDIKEIYWESTC